MSTLNKNIVIVKREDNLLKLNWKNDGKPFMRLTEEQAKTTIPDLERAGIILIRTDLGEPIDPITPEELSAGALACALKLLAKATGLPYQAAKAAVFDKAIEAAQDREASRRLAEDIHRELKEFN